ncbi:peptidase S9A prolyl oligopeptidase domain protein beta-propeller [Chytriomyces sp. MP71]|nr:peptidase S9A prolyl oligopeptidase domain protein beta-propeller [Chytriomyces sp. MP71]
MKYPRKNPSETYTKMPPVPPIAKKEVTIHAYGDGTPDLYHWLKDQTPGTVKREDIMEYLKAENEYAQQVHYRPNTQLSETIYKELLAKIEETDQDVAYFKAPYWYYNKTIEGEQYAIRCRRFETMESPEEEYLNPNLWKEFEYIDVHTDIVSPSHKILAYAMDNSGYEHYKILFKDLETGEQLSDVLEKTTANLVWNQNNTAIYYTTLDAINRPDKLWIHVLGTSQSDDVLLYHNTDEKFYTYVQKSLSGRFLYLNLASSQTSEVHYIDFDSASRELKCFAAREHRHLYSIDHQGDYFVIKTNGGGHFLNNKIQRVRIDNPAKDLWEDVVAYDPYREISGFVAFESFLLIEEVSQSIHRLRIFEASGDSYLIPFDDEIFHASFSDVSGKTRDYKSDSFRFNYTNALTPQKLMEYNVVNKEATLLKQKPVPGGFDATPYTYKRIYVPIPEETRVKAPFDTPVSDTIPVTLLYRTDLLQPNGKNKLHLYAYGSYGYPMMPNFNAGVFSLVDRGIVHAIAHIRGGGENGRAWYETGKFLHKKNTFTDYIACAEYLVAAGYSKHEIMSIEGRSAGGLLMGAVMNLKPDIAYCAIAGVPFVDVINTMMDASIPLTVGEYEEWGNPNEKEYFDYMLSYSPYENIKPNTRYPNLLIKAGINDPRVAYWEPAKYAAKMRASNTQLDGHVLISDTKLGSGHFGSSGRYGAYKEKASDYAFIVKQLEDAWAKAFPTKWTKTTTTTTTTTTTKSGAMGGSTVKTVTTVSTSYSPAI